MTVPLREEHGWLPDLDAFDRVGRDRPVLDVLPEQPDRRGRAALVLRGACRARPRARLPALLRRGVLRAVVRRAAGVGAPGRRPLERRRLQHALEALVDDGLPLGVRLRATGGHRGAAPLPADGRHGAAGVRPARVDRRLVGRRARRRGARDLPAQARDRCCPRSRRAACGSPGRARRSTSGSTSAARPSRSRGGCSSTASSALQARSSVRPARATSASRSCRRSRSANARRRSSGRCCEHRRRDRGARPRRGARRRARRRRLAGQPRRAGGDPRLLPAAAARAARGRAVRVPRQDPAEDRLRGARRARRPARDRALRRLPLARRRADAVVRQHRRLGRPGDDGRHVGDRRLRARRSAPTCISPAASASAACSSRRARAR